MFHRGFAPILIILAITLLAVGAGGVVYIAQDEQAGEKEVLCIQIYSPVCGVDGTTYSNQCVAEKQNNVDIAYYGTCVKAVPIEEVKKEVDEAVLCSNDYVPVCGVNGKTYINKCLARDAAIGIDYVGACKALIKKVEPTQEPVVLPTSTPTAETCSAEYIPVCGVNNKTYANNCFAAEAGAEIQHSGICSTSTTISETESAPVDQGPLPDLAFKVFSHYGSTLTEEDLMSFSAVVINNGEEKTVTDFLTSLTIDKNNDGVDHIVMRKLVTGPLAPGKSELKVWRNAFVLRAGTHSAKVCTDIGKVIAESDESNNCDSIIFTVVQKDFEPDLIIESISITPASPFVGDRVSVTSVVKNQGAKSAGASFTRFRIDATTLGFFDAGAIIPIPAGASEKKSLSQIWLAIKGTHRLEVCADARKALRELDERNNCKELIFEVRASAQ